MPTDAHAASHRRIRNFLAVLTLAAALVFGLASFALRVVDPWWSAMLANAAVTVLLVLPAAWAGDAFTRALRRVSKVAVDAKVAATDAEGAAQDARELAQGAQADAAAATEVLSAAERRRTASEDLEQELLQEQRVSHQADLDVIERWGEVGDRDSTIAALRVAEAADLIARTGVRVSVWETELHLRFRYEPTLEVLDVLVEGPDGSPLGAASWPAGEDARVFYKKIIALVEQTGQSPGPGLVSPIRSVRTLADALRHGLSVQAQKLMLGSEHFHRITGYLGDIDFPDGGWYLTERGIFPRARDYYLVEAARLKERFWERHLLDKGWFDAPRALSVARAERGITELVPPLPPPSPTIEVRGY